MLAYSYDSNGYFTKKCKCQIDQLESKNYGREIWLLPANSTFKEPLPEKEGFKIKFENDNWIYEKIPTPIVPTLEDLKISKRSEINFFRDAAEQGGFEYLGKVFDSDSISCQRISCAAQAMSFMPASEENKIVWTCQDNSTIELTADELSGLVVALSQWSIKCHTKASELKAKIDSAKTAEELEAIVWA